MVNPKHVTIYTDGSSSNNVTRCGGWAALLIYGVQEKMLSGNEADTTNNRMELTAVINALEALKEPCQVTLYSDAEYIVKGVTAWMPRWIRKNWQGVLNEDLWQRLVKAAAPHEIEWVWVRGHNGNRNNERVDQEAVRMRKILEGMRE